jgi:hypothetical protein
VNRRRLLAAVAAGGASVLAGCLGDADRRGGRASATPATPGPPVDAAGLPALPVPADELVRAANRDALPAITDPAFAADWGGVELETRTEFGVRRITPRLADFDRVIGVVRDGEARAYPLRVLDWHEVVNDAFGEPLLVTYCPLCRSAVVASRVVDGAATTFGVSGLLWRHNLVLYDDRTGSHWSQFAGTAIRGPLTGERLSLRPATLTTWAAWRDRHPGTRVLLPPPFSGTVVGRGSPALRDYTAFPYAGYEGTDRLGASDESFADDRLDPKTTVLGLTHGGVARAYPKPAVAAADVVTDTVGGRPVVVTVADDALVAYDRSVGGRARTVTAAGPAHLRAAGSRWDRATGRAVDGPHAGERLTPATTLSGVFWFVWLDFHPDTEVYGRG